MKLWYFCCIRRDVSKTVYTSLLITLYLVVYVSVVQTSKIVDVPWKSDPLGLVVGLQENVLSHPGIQTVNCKKKRHVKRPCFNFKAVSLQHKNFSPDLFPATSVFSPTWALRVAFTRISTDRSHGFSSRKNSLQAMKAGNKETGESALCDNVQQWVCDAFFDSQTWNLLESLWPISSVRFFSCKQPLKDTQNSKGPTATTAKLWCTMQLSMTQCVALIPLFPSCFVCAADRRCQLIHHWWWR